MKIKEVAHTIEGIYYSGRPTVSKKMDVRDFMMLARMAHGTIMRRIYYEERQAGNLYGCYFSDQFEDRKFKLEGKGNRRFFIIEDEERNSEKSGVYRLPYALGIFLIEPVTEDGEDEHPDIIRSEAGAEWLYTGAAFQGQTFWSPRGKKIMVYNLNKCYEEVNVVGIWNDSDIDIPTDVAFDIVVLVLRESLKTITIPVDRTNDDDPNTKNIKSALNTP